MSEMPSNRAMEIAIGDVSPTTPFDERRSFLHTKFAHTGSNGCPVFLHSSFRTSSTWIWLAFRRNPRTRAYYEIFNECLVHMRPQDIAKTRYDTWNSKHPPSEPYYVEFSDLLSPEGGVHSLLPEMPFGTFVPKEGLDGQLSTAERNYVAMLIDAATESGQQPVITCCRLLGRLGAVKREFEGWNIFVYRNLFRQWMSYLGQYNCGNSYFLKATVQTINLNRHDPFLSELANECLSDPAESGAEFDGFRDLRSAFRGFVGLHLYLSMKAFSEADQTIEVDRLSDDHEYLAETQTKIERHTGLSVDLADARTSIESAGAMSYAPTNIAELVEELRDKAARHLGIAEGSPVFAFGKKLTGDLLKEEANYRTCTGSMQKQLSASLTENCALKTENCALKDDIVRTLEELDKARDLVRDLVNNLQSIEESTAWRLMKLMRISNTIFDLDQQSIVSVPRTDPRPSFHLLKG